MTITRLMPAATKSLPNSQDGKGVNALAIFESRQAADKRASDGSAELDRILLLEWIEQRRKAEKRKASIEAGIYSLRSNR